MNLDDSSIFHLSGVQHAELPNRFLPATSSWTAAVGGNILVHLNNREIVKHPLFDLPAICFVVVKE
jgi:hypothetical protein